jgi:hypothetical protein
MVSARFRMPNVSSGNRLIWPQEVLLVFVVEIAPRSGCSVLSGS